VAQVQEAVQSNNINPNLLMLELTESMLIESVEDTVASMNALSKLGVKFSLERFWDWLSSLQYLKKLPLDQIKIDRFFYI